MHILSPSMLSADYGYLADNFATLRRAGVTWIHIDNMDGAFVPNLSIGIPIVKSVRKCTDLFFDVHLMINEPIRYVKEFAAAGSDLITVHYEACSDLDATLAAIAEARPTDPAGLLAVPGIGPVKFERFGPQLLALIASVG